MMNQQETTRRDRYIQQAVQYYIYMNENPDWSGLEKELKNLEYTSNEVYCIMLSVREGEY